MGNKTIERKTQSEWKIQLTMKMNFVSTLPDSNEIRIMHAKSDNMEIITGSETNEIMEKNFKSIQQRYQKKKQESMKGSHFTFDGVNIFYYDLNIVKLSRGK